MAQAFVSTYKNHYRWNCQPKVAPFDPSIFTKLEPEGEEWLLDSSQQESQEEEVKNLLKIEEAIHNLYLRRMRSTYQISYCDMKPQRKRKSLIETENAELTRDQSTTTRKTEQEQENLENQLLEFCKNLYGPRKGKIVPPLNSARNVFGYMRPSRLRTPLTIYQNEYGKVGFDILKATHEKT